MATFHFNLQAELDKRRSVEDAAQQGLAKVLRENLILQTQLSEMRESVYSDRARLAGALAGAVNVQQIQRHATHAGQVQLRSGQMVTRIAELDQQAAAARSRLAEASKRRKAIERLRDKQWAKWRAGQQRRQASELEDLITIAHVRRLLGLATE